jgi:ADP-ribose pyrophosphatase
MAGWRLLKWFATREGRRPCRFWELQEEIGYRAASIRPLVNMLSAVGFCDERVYLYLATDLTPVPSALEEDEFIHPVVMTLKEALRLLDGGAILDAKTQLALLLAARLF